METPTTPAPAPAPAPPPPTANEPKKKPPLDPAARAKAAERAALRKLTKKLEAAKSTEEFWSLADELAKKNGKKLEAPAQGGEKSEPDPLDVPIAPSWPTPRQIAEVQPIVTGGLAMLAQALEGTRYGQLSEVIKVPMESGTLEVRKAAILETPAAACVALLTKGKAPDLHPGWAMLGATVIVFGPPAAAHAWEVFGPRVKAWWNGEKRQPEKPAAAIAPVVQFEKPKTKRAGDEK